ncbi:unnamed protein product [Urochloa decumbens]|uniref:F-box domain-containing protein n=1 Tax=Urochloa decumbens TaxID=240449 RepID=A0ABC9GAA1_9POAL
MASQGSQIRGGSGDIGGGAAVSNHGVLPEDVLYEIFQRVPARPLCRFRAVCKPWLSLLTDPPFVAAHKARRHREDPLFAVVVEVDSSTKGNVAEIKLLDTSGRAVKQLSAGPAWPLMQMRPHLDLVLLRGVSGNHRICLAHKALRLLDPATGAATSLPMPNCNGSYSSSFVLGRAAAVSSTGGHGEYKVLSLSLDSSLYATLSCRVLTVGGDGTWRTAPTPPVSIRTFGVVANGIVYHLVNNASTWLIAAFDLEAELWQPSLLQGPLPVPSIDGYAQPGRSLAELNGHLAAVSTTISIMDIWLLVDSSKWSKQCRVRTSSIVWPYAMDAEPLWVLDDGRIALWVRASNMRTGALWMYDPRTETCTKVAVMENCLNVGVGAYTGNLLL